MVRITKKEQKKMQNQKRSHTKIESFEDEFLLSNRYLVGENMQAPRNGLCKGEDPAIFFPVLKKVRYSAGDFTSQKKAIEICRPCKLRGDCLTYSLEYEPHGIWGGFPEATRGLIAQFWGIQNKRKWGVRTSFLRYSRLVDYVVEPEDIKFIKKVAHDKNFAQPPFDERFGVSSSQNR